MTLKSKVKLIKSLQLKKYRLQEQSFVVEGWKSVESLLRSDFKVTLLASTRDYADAAEDLINQTSRTLDDGFYITDASELVKLGSIQTNDSVLAVAKMKPEQKPEVGGERILVLDDIRDPGNLGTIIRTADWFGIRQVIASENSVDFYNPKVIRSTMGSFCHVRVSYVNLPEFLSHQKVPVYGAFLDGEKIQDVKLEADALVVIGNESNGISVATASFINRRVSIEGFGNAESLNASVAAGIILYAASLES